MFVGVWRCLGSKVYIFYSDLWNCLWQMQMCASEANTSTNAQQELVDLLLAETVNIHFNITHHQTCISASLTHLIYQCTVEHITLY